MGEIFPFPPPARTAMIPTKVSRFKFKLNFHNLRRQLIQNVFIAELESTPIFKQAVEPLLVENPDLDAIYSGEASGVSGDSLLLFSKTNNQLFEKNKIVASGNERKISKLTAINNNVSEVSYTEDDVDDLEISGYLIISRKNSGDKSGNDKNTESKNKITNKDNYVYKDNFVDQYASGDNDAVVDRYIFASGEDSANNDVDDGNASSDRNTYGNEKISAEEYLTDNLLAANEDVTVDLYGSGNTEVLISRNADNLLNKSAEASADEEFFISEIIDATIDQNPVDEVIGSSIDKNFDGLVNKNSDYFTDKKVFVYKDVDAFIIREPDAVVNEDSDALIDTETDSTVDKNVDTLINEDADTSIDKDADAFIKKYAVLAEKEISISEVSNPSVNEDATASVDGSAGASIDEDTNVLVKKEKLINEAANLSVNQNAADMLFDKNDDDLMDKDVDVAVNKNASFNEKALITESTAASVDNHVDALVEESFFSNKDAVDVEIEEVSFYDNLSKKRNGNNLFDDVKGNSMVANKEVATDKIAIDSNQKRYHNGKNSESIANNMDGRRQEKLPGEYANGEDIDRKFANGEVANGDAAVTEENISEPLFDEEPKYEREPKTDKQILDDRELFFYGGEKIDDLQKTLVSSEKSAKQLTDPSDSANKVPKKINGSSPKRLRKQQLEKLLPKLQQKHCKG